MSESNYRELNEKIQKSQSALFLYSILRVDFTEKLKLHCFLRLLTIKRISIHTRLPRRKQSIR